MIEAVGFGEIFILGIAHGLVVGFLAVAVGEAFSVLKAATYI